MDDNATKPSVPRRNNSTSRALGLVIVSAGAVALIGWAARVPVLYQLVRRLAEAHGGSVGVVSTPGEGGRFSATLPWVAAEPRAAHLDLSAATAQARELGAAALLLKPIDREMFGAALGRAPARGAEPLVERALVVGRQERARILLAEDNQSNIDVLSDYLQAQGYAITVARNGLEALVRAQEEPPDLILMDIQMPGMDGLEAIRRIRAEGVLAETPIIAVTALAMPGDRERCLLAGANEYLAKPVRLRSLVATIELQRLKRSAPQPQRDTDDQSAS